MLETLNRQFYQPADELAVADTAGLPELRVHADLGEAGDCVDLVDIEFSLLGKEEVHAAHTFAVQGLESPDRHLLHALHRGRIQLRWYLETGPLGVQVFRLVGIELVGRDDLAGDGGLRRLITQHRTLDLPAL